MEDQLREITKLLQPKEGYSFIFSSNSTDWITHFSPPFNLDPEKKYELALVNLETYNSVPNISSTNNTFVYSPSGGVTWKTISLPEGSYELTQINEEIQCQLKANGDWNSGREGSEAYNIAVGANRATLRAYIEITGRNYKVDTGNSTLARTLGFEPNILPTGFHTGDRPVDISTLSSILVNCDLVSASYLDGNHQPVVYSFYPGVGPGYKVLETPSQLIYLPVSQRGNIQRIRIWLTDERGSQLNLRGEKLTIRMHLRQI